MVRKIKLKKSEDKKDVPYQWIVVDWATCPKCSGQVEMYRIDLVPTPIEEAVVLCRDCKLPGTVHFEESLDPNPNPHIRWRGGD